MFGLHQFQAEVLSAWTVKSVASNGLHGSFEHAPQQASAQSRRSPSAKEGMVQAKNPPRRPNLTHQDSKRKYCFNETSVNDTSLFLSLVENATYCINYSMKLHFFLLAFWAVVSLFSSGWPGTHHNSPKHWDYRHDHHTQLILCLTRGI